LISRIIEIDAITEYENRCEMCIVASLCSATKYVTTFHQNWIQSEEAKVPQS